MIENAVSMPQTLSITLESQTLFQVRLKVKVAYVFMVYQTADAL